MYARQTAMLLPLIFLAGIGLFFYFVVQDWILGLVALLLTAATLTVLNKYAPALKFSMF